MSTDEIYQQINVAMLYSLISIDLGYWLFCTLLNASWWWFVFGSVALDAVLLGLSKLLATVLVSVFCNIVEELSSDD